MVIYKIYYRNTDIAGPERFDECLSLIKEHSLYSQAMEIFSDKSSHEHKVRCDRVSGVCCHGN